MSLIAAVRNSVAWFAAVVPNCTFAQFAGVPRPDPALAASASPSPSRCGDSSLARNQYRDVRLKMLVASRFAIHTTGRWREKGGRASGYKRAVLLRAHWPLAGR